MFLLVEGLLSVSIPKPDSGEEVQVARLIPGTYFGEMSLLTGDARTATVCAATDCDVIELTAEAFRSFLMAQPAVADEIVAAVEKRRAELEQHRAARVGRVSATEPSRSITTRMRQFLRLSAR